MKRRTFLGFGVGLVGVKSVENLKMEETDLLVVTYDKTWTEKDLHCLSGTLEKRLGHTNFVLVPDSLKMKVVKNGRFGGGA